MDSALAPELANNFLVCREKIDFKVVHSNIDRFTTERTL